MSELILPSSQEIWGVDGKGQLEVFRKYGAIAASTDLAILTGSYLPETDKIDEYVYVPDDDSLKGRVAWYYTQSVVPANYPHDVSICGCNSNGEANRFRLDARVGSIRPLFRSPIIFSQLLSSYRIKGFNGTEEVEFGEYPQYAPNLDIQKILFFKKNKGFLLPTGKRYTFNKIEPYSDYSIAFLPEVYEEYYYNGKKYICVKANLNHKDCCVKLSNGELYKNGDYVWIEVLPVKWLIDDETEILVSKRGLLSGISFYSKKDYTSNFFTTDNDMQEYLNKFMIIDLLKDATFKRKIQGENMQKDENVQVLSYKSDLLSVIDTNNLLEEIDCFVKEFDEDFDIIYEEKKTLWDTLELDKNLVETQEMPIGRNGKLLILLIKEDNNIRVVSTYDIEFYAMYKKVLKKVKDGKLDCANSKTKELLNCGIEKIYKEFFYPQEAYALGKNSYEVYQSYLLIKLSKAAKKFQEISLYDWQGNYIRNLQSLGYEICTTTDDTFYVKVIQTKDKNRIILWENLNQQEWLYFVVNAYFSALLEFNNKKINFGYINPNNKSNHNESTIIPIEKFDPKIQMFTRQLVLPYIGFDKKVNKYMTQYEIKDEFELVDYLCMEYNYPRSEIKKRIQERNLIIKIEGEKSENDNEKFIQRTDAEDIKFYKKVNDIYRRVSV